MRGKGLRFQGLSLRRAMGYVSDRDSVEKQQGQNPLTPLLTWSLGDAHGIGVGGTRAIDSFNL